MILFLYIEVIPFCDFYYVASIAFSYPLAILWPSSQRIPAFPWLAKPCFLNLTLSIMKWLKSWPHFFLLPATQQVQVVRALLVFHPNSCVFSQVFSLLFGNIKQDGCFLSSSSELSVRFLVDKNLYSNI